MRLRAISRRPRRRLQPLHGLLSLRVARPIHGERPFSPSLRRRQSDLISPDTTQYITVVVDDDDDDDSAAAREFRTFPSPDICPHDHLLLPRKLPSPASVTGPITITPDTNNPSSCRRNEVAAAWWWTYDSKYHRFDSRPLRFRVS